MSEHSRSRRNIHIPREEIAALCERNAMLRLSLGILIPWQNGRLKAAATKT